jgi:hypothetical protein
MITYKHHRHAKHNIKHKLILIFETVVIPPTVCRPSMNLPALDACCSSLSAVGHPRAGTKLHRAGNPRLGKVNERHTVTEEGFSPRSHLCPLLTDPHSPHACPTPGVYTFTVTWTVLRLLNLPCLGLQQQTRPEVSELCGSYRTPSRSSHFLRALSHLERVAHRLGNLFF